MHPAHIHNAGAIAGHSVTVTVASANAVVVCPLGNEYLSGATMRPQLVAPLGRVRLQVCFRNNEMPLASAAATSPANAAFVRPVVKATIKSAIHRYPSPRCDMPRRTNSNLFN